MPIMGTTLHLTVRYCMPLALYCSALCGLAARLDCRVCSQGRGGLICSRRRRLLQRLLSQAGGLRMAVQPVLPALEIQRRLPNPLRRGLRADLPLFHPGHSTLEVSNETSGLTTASFYCTEKVLCTRGHIEAAHGKVCLPTTALRLSHEDDFRTRFRAFKSSTCLRSCVRRTLAARRSAGR